MTQLASNFYAWRAALDNDPETVHVATHIAPLGRDRMLAHMACKASGPGETLANYETASGLAPDERPVTCGPCRQAIVVAQEKLDLLLEAHE